MIQIELFGAPQFNSIQNIHVLLTKKKTIVRTSYQLYFIQLLANYTLPQMVLGLSFHSHILQ